MDQDNKNYTTEHTILHTDVSRVFVVRHSKKRPFIEAFEHTSINFTQKNLGTILGFFIVRDDTADSENIVNFLASEVKKRYFAPTDKSVEDKFESTLHHVNRVLEEIANIGNVAWLGTIEGAVCVIDNTAIHFSITGNAHILLLRDNILMDISDGLASPEATNYPLKTFVDISSGDIAPHDKIIITSQELLDLIPFEELQKNALRMGQRNFIQFIETALTNECTIASTTIIDVIEAEHTQPPPQIAQPKELPENFFGANTYEQEVSSPSKEMEGEIIIDIDELTRDEEDAPAEYTDPRTGHMYIQGTNEIIPKPSLVETTQEKVNDAYDTTKTFTQKQWRNLLKKISGMSRRTNPEIENIFHDITSNQSQEKFNNNANLTQDIIEKIKWYFFRIWTISKVFFIKTSTQCINIITRKTKNLNTKDLSQKSQNHDIGSSQKISYILPSIDHITHLWHSMNSTTRMSAIGIVVFMILIPLIFAFFTRNTPTDPVIPSEDVVMETQTNIEELPITTTTQNTIIDPITLYQSNEIVQIVLLRNIPFGIEKRSISMFDDAQEKFPLPNNVGTIVNASPMEDLNLIFFITSEDKLYSFSPIAKKYEEQKNFPQFDHTKINAISTYLTYLYILNNTMITRHTRIDNGFDDGKKWLDNSLDFTNADDMAINEDIYITQQNTITKLADGKKINYIQDSMIAMPHHLHTNEDMDFVWILDTTNTILFKTAKNDGSVVEKFLHNDLSTATSLAVDEKKNIAFVSTPEKTLQFSLSN